MNETLEQLDTFFDNFYRNGNHDELLRKTGHSLSFFLATFLITGDTLLPKIRGLHSVLSCVRREDVRREVMVHIVKRHAVRQELWGDDANDMSSMEQAYQTLSYGGFDEIKRKLSPTIEEMIAYHPRKNPEGNVSLLLDVCDCFLEDRYSAIQATMTNENYLSFRKYRRETYDKFEESCQDETGYHALIVGIRSHFSNGSLTISMRK